jgi:hypothetical protein
VISSSKEEVQDDRKDNAEKDRCDNRKIEGEVLTLNDDIARKLAQEGDLWAQQEDDPENDDKETDSDQELTEKSRKLKHQVNSHPRSIE